MRWLLVAILLIIPVASSAATHSFTGLPITSAGWTDYQVLIASGNYASSRVIFVSNDGNDGTGSPGTIANLSYDANGMFMATGEILPYATVAAGYAQVRDGYSDILLLERGDTWVTRFSSGGIGNWLKSGASSAAPIIFSSYGTGARPQITSDNVGTALTTYDTNNLLISNIYFYLADWTLAKRAVDIIGTSDHITYEDCRIDGHHEGKIQGTGVTNIAIRRCVFYGNQAHDGQLYAESASDVLIEENVFSTPYDEDYIDGSPLGRHLYFSAGDCGNDCLNGVILRGNIFYASDREGADIRCGGEIYHNLFVQSYLRVGDVGSGVRQISSGDIYSNVLMEGSTNTGTATIISLLANDGSRAYDNIITDNTGITVNAMGISVSGNSGSTPSNMVARNIDVSNNIVYKYTNASSLGYGFKIESGLSDVQNISVNNNQFQFDAISTGDLLYFPTADIANGSFIGNRYYSTATESTWFYQGNAATWAALSGETGYTTTQIAYTAPTRIIGSYDTQIGGAGTTANFMASTLNQSRQNWSNALTAYAAINYIRAGFDKRPVTPEWEQSIARSAVDLTGSAVKVDLTGSALDMVMQ